jgi:hypothetical protein
MATTLKPTYAANATITITLTSLASAAYRQSAAVDNTTNLYADAMIYGHVKSLASAGLNNIYSLFLVWSNDGGTTYSNNASGSDASYAQPDNDANMQIGSVSLISPAPASPMTYYFPPFSFCQRAGLLFLPQKWAIIVKNGAAVALTATSTDHVFSYQGVNWQNV